MASNVDGADDREESLRKREQEGKEKLMKTIKHIYIRSTIL